MPPASLRYRVHGHPDANGFLKVGRRCSDNIGAALEQVGKDFDSFRNVLDFGCGCGRTIIWLADRLQSARLSGTDVDAEAISWCRAHLDLATFRVNDPLPPLEYPSEAFDLVYAISVFTHLDEEYQFRWLDELKRIAEPGSIVLLTVHGRHAWNNLPREDVTDLKARGFKFLTSNTFKGIFPEWYQSAYHTKRYILNRYSDYFDILAYIPSGMGRMQDVVVLQKSIDRRGPGVLQGPSARGNGGALERSCYDS